MNDSKTPGGGLLTTPKQKKQLAYFLSHPIQYFSPLLKELAKNTNLKVYYFSYAGIRGNLDKGFGHAVRWDTPLLEGYTSQFLNNFSKRGSLDNHFFDVFNPGVIKALWNEKSSIIIVNGWTYSSTLLTIFFGRIFGKQVWLRAENPYNQEILKDGRVLRIKKLLLKYLLFKYFISKCLYIGSESKLFFEFYGVSSKKLVYTPYAVDNDFFSSQSLALKNDLAAIRRRLGLPVNKLLILFCGKYISKKRPMDLIRAFQLLDDPRYALVMVGDGPLRHEMENYISENRLQDIYLTGFINQSAISNYYAVADVFVMCSGMGETWGLSVNEAMNFEKPIVVSKTCGCCSDLVKHGENGFSFEEGNIIELAEYLNHTLSDSAFRSKAGRKSAQLVKEFSISCISKNILSAIN